jgi:hypothetical protein
MRKRIIRFGMAALAAGLLSVAAFGQGEPGPEHYSAVWAVTGGSAGGTTVPVDIRINKYTTEAEITQYAMLLQGSNGPAALRSALEKLDVGQFSPVGKVGTPLAIARKLPKGDKTEIRVLTLRIMSFTELRNGGRSVDYPYTMLTFEVDKDGKGTGTAIGAAKISFNKKKNVYEIESFRHGADYNKLLNVRLLK